MRRAIKAIVIAGVVGLMWAPSIARADGYVAPFAGITFGGEARENKGMYGVDAGWMGAGIIGVEVDFGYSPHFFSSNYDNHVWDLMGNVIIGIPIGGQHGAGFRPYVTAGLGTMEVQIAPGVTSVGEYKTNNFAFNVGAGANVYFSDHFGVRGDIRYLRNITSNDSINPVNFSLSGFDFWRAAVGFVIR
jgi:opacity protein-like surface antigen